MPYLPLTRLAHDAIRAIDSQGDVLIDATVGNGHDTLFLSRLMAGHDLLFGFDVQQRALQKTERLLKDTNPTALEDMGFKRPTKLNFKKPEITQRRSGPLSIELPSSVYREVLIYKTPTDRGKCGKPVTSKS